MKDKDPETLENKLQVQANHSVQWIRDNEMVCSGEKTKLLIISTKELRQSKLTSIDKKIKVNVCGKTITESKSEKLSGIMIDNDLTFKTYLYGNDKTGSDKETGILTKLSQRIGILKKLSSVVTRSQLKSISDDIFNSKLRYCLPLFCNVWTDTDKNQRFAAFTKNDSNRLQVLQNKVLRLITGLNRYTSTSTLLSTSNELSVNQMAAFHT